MEAVMLLIDEIWWDKSGEPVLAMVDNWIIGMDGAAVGFIERDGAVYTIKGEHRGWYEYGVLRDQTGYCLCLSNMPSDPRHPGLPATLREPPKIPLGSYPVIYPMVVFTTPAPLPQSKWSPLDVRQCFGLPAPLLERQVGW
jgi:hypothetical protein